MFLTGLFIAAMVAMGQQAPESDVMSVGPGISKPQLIHKQDPSYTNAARDAGIQGNVLLQIVVNESGVAQDINVLSPLGFGLDEKAIEAVSAWRFKPGEKQGIPVKIRATVQISFRLNQSFDEKAEARRTKFNATMARLSLSLKAKPSEKDVKSMEELASQKMPAASYVLGVWQMNGNGVPKDETSGFENIRKAEKLDYGPAMYFVGKAEMKGDLMPQDVGKGLSLIREAASLGSTEAQFMLGNLYQKGSGAAVDLERSKRYFRLCAASGTPECQFRLGRLLIDSEKRKESDWLQGIAWLELAQGHGFSAAKEAVESEAAQMSGEQKQQVARLRDQLERKP